ncbi:oligosaccharide flippase family protein [Flavobacterium sp. JP2137]|uniref:oligosaccharide flippase family protein n=1 Tax=Flavobacterium sp. JP2137 TaxID=3414510 RepID=UPI003D2FC92E
MNVGHVQLRRNLYSNMASLLVNICIGILYTPYLVRELGISAYGLVPLALIINQYIGVLTDALTSSLTRFYMIAIQEENWQSASRYLSSSFFLILGIILLCSIPAFVFVDRIDSVFNIPEAVLVSAKYLFAFTILSFFCSLISSILNIVLFTLNRLDYLNVIKIIRGAVKPFLVFVFFNCIAIDLTYIGLANVIGELVILGCSYWFYKKFTHPQIKLSLGHFNKTALVSLVVMSVWVIVQSVGDLGIYRIDVVILNLFWSTKESGIIGSFSELGAYLSIISVLFVSLFGPLILNAYSQGDHEKVKELTLDNSLIIGIAVAVMVGVLIGFSNFVVTFWLGEAFTSYTRWFSIKLILLPFYTAAGFFVNVTRSWNKVRFPALMTVLFGLLNFALIYSVAQFFEKTNQSIDWILMISLIFGILQSYFLNGLYFSKLYKNTIKVVCLNFIKTASVLAVVAFTCSFVSAYLIGRNTLTNVVVILLLGMFFLPLSLGVFLDKRQRNALIQIVLKNK